MAARARRTTIALTVAMDAPMGNGEQSMDRYNRRIFFERLCELRDSYGRLGPDDTTSVITIEAMVVRGRALLARRGSPLVLMLDRDGKAADAA